SYQDRSGVLEPLREGARQDGGVAGADPTGDRHATQLEGSLLNGSRIGVRQDAEVDVTSAEIALRHQPAQDRWIDGDQCFCRERCRGFRSGCGGEYFKGGGLSGGGSAGCVTILLLDLFIGLGNP